MNKYQYGVEYQHKGYNPVELPYGIDIELYCVDDGKWYPSKSSDRTVWSDWDAFRIVDEGYKPKEQNKYTRTLKGQKVDVYDVLKAFNVTDPALQHLIKKALCCGLRGHKDQAQDLQDIVDSAKRAVELSKD